MGEFSCLPQHSQASLPAFPSRPSSLREVVGVRAVRRRLLSEPFTGYFPYIRGIYIVVSSSIELPPQEKVRRQESRAGGQECQRIRMLPLDRASSMTHAMSLHGLLPSSPPLLIKEAVAERLS